MKKFFFAIIFFFVGLILVIFFFSPAFLSTSQGKKLVIWALEKTTQSHVKVEKFSLSLFGTQHIEKCHISKKDAFDFGFQHLESNTFFWSLFLPHPTLKNTHIEKPFLTLHPKKTSSLSSSFKKKFKSPKPRKKKEIAYPSLEGTFSLNEGEIHVQKNLSETLSIAHLFVSMNPLKKPLLFSIKTKGKTKQGDLFGHFDSDLKISWEKNSTPPFEIEGKATMQDLPTETLDFLIALIFPQKKGILQASLGDSFNLNLSLQKASESQNISLQLRSPRLFTSLLAHKDKVGLSLKEPMRLAWTLKPPIINSIFKVPFFQLKSDLQAELQLEKAALSFQKGKWHFPSLSIAGKLGLKQGLLLLKKKQNSILLDQIDVTFNTSQLSHILTCSFENKFRFNALPTTLMEGSSKWHHLFSGDRSPFNLLSQLKIHVNNFPTKLLSDNPFFEMPYLEHFLGSNLDCQAKFEENEIGKKDLFVTLSSPYLHLLTSEFLIDQGITLTSPLTLTYFASSKHLPLLSSPLKIDATVKTFNIPPHKNSFAWKEMQLSCDFQTSPLDLKHFFRHEKIVASSFKGTLKGKYSDAFSLKTSSKLSFPKNHWLNLFNPSVLNFSMQGDISLDNGFHMDPLLIALKGKNLLTQIEGKVSDHAFILGKPLKLDLPITPQIVNPLVKKVRGYPLLQEKTQLQLQIKKAVFPLKKEAMSHLQLQTYGTLQQFKATPIDKKPPFFSLQNIDFEFNLNGKERKNSMQCDMKVKTRQNKVGHIEFLVKNDKSPAGLFKSPSYFKIGFEHLSSQVTNTFFQKKGIISPIIGPEINLFYEMEQKNGIKEIKTRLSGAYLQLKGTFHVKKKFLTLKNQGSPFKIDLKLSNQGLHAYRKWRGLTKNASYFPYTIEGRSKIHLSFDHLSLPLKKEPFFLFPQINWNLYASTFNTIMGIESIVFKEKKKNEKSELSNFDLTLKKTSIKKPLFFEVDGNIAFNKKKNEKGKVIGKGHLKNFLTKKGNLDLKNVTTSINLTLSHFPTLFLDAFYQLNSPSKMPPSAILGNTLNATCLIDLIKENGKVFIDLNASACKTLVKGKVKQGIFYLDEPLNATLAITPKLNDRLYANSGIKIAAMKHPIFLTLSHKNFKLPIRNPHIKNTTLSYGKINFGRLLCQNRGSTLELGEIFKIKPNQHLIELWFAPFEFQIKKGKLSINRTEILFNQAYQIALWGKLNFQRHFAYMTLGLTAQSLEKALGFQKLPSNYVFQIPIEGPFGKIKIDKKAVTSKLALLLAQQSVPPDKSIWGQVIGTIGSFVDDQSKVPPPNSPFPWEN